MIMVEVGEDEITPFPARAWRRPWGRERPTTVARGQGKVVGRVGGHDVQVAIAIDIREREDLGE